MSLLDEATLREKLGRINTTQQVIETTSTWCCFFPKEARRIALIWEDVFSKSDQAKRLALVYLANDVLQNSRKKGPEFVTEFFKVLPRALRHMLSKADAKTAASINKVIRVWEERRVFGSGSKSFKQLMEESDTPGRSIPGPGSKALPPIPTPAVGGGTANGADGLASPTAVLSAAAKLPSLQPLVQALQQVHQAALRCAQLSSACKAAAAAVQAGSADEVASHKASVQQYVSAVQAERDARQQAVSALQSLLRTQEEASARLASQLDQAAHQLEALDQRSAQLQKSAAAPPAQLLDLLQFLPPQQVAAAPTGAAGQGGPQPMYGVVAGESGQLPLLPARQGVDMDEQPAMDLSDDYSATAVAAIHAAAPMQRHPSLQGSQAPFLPVATAAPAAFTFPPQHAQQVLPLSTSLPSAPAASNAQPAVLPSARAPFPAPYPAPAVPAVETPSVATTPAPALGGGRTGASSDAAALAAQLTSNEQSAQALLEALLALPQDQLQSGEFRMGGAPPAAGAQHAKRGTHPQQAQQGGEEEYDPEDPFGD